VGITGSTRDVGHIEAAMMYARQVVGTMVVALLAGSSAWAASPEPAESARLMRAKDLMSEEQWVAAIPVLRAALADPKEQNRDEALFWLAHSQNQAGDLAEAVDSIRQLQRNHPKSRWSAPAYSLLIELAQKLGRNDVLWWTATTPRPIPAPAPAPPRAGRARAVPPPPPAPPQPAVPPATAPVPAPPTPPPPPMPSAWVSETYLPDADMRVQALGRLIHTDAQKVIPILVDIALESNPATARRAVFVLAQSRNPEAQMLVVDLAKRGAESVRLAAVKELGRFGGPNISAELLKVYSSADLQVKQQVVVSLGQRADKTALLRIAQSEANPQLRDAAILTLGRAGGGEQLRVLYRKAVTETRQAVIRGLFNARDVDGLIRIAEDEKDPQLREEVRARLRLIGTPQARAYLEKAR
jgi:HEAT repeat protein